MASKKLLLGVSLCSLLASCTTAKDYSNYPAGVTNPYASIRHVSYARPVDKTLQNDRIQAQDLLEIKVYKVAELSQSMRVDDGGNISLPLIGSIYAKGLTARELEKKIENTLSQRYMNDPHVTVVVKEAVKRRVTIEGYAVSPGVYPVAGGGTLLQAIATAGGLSEFADIHKIFLFRKSANGEVSRYHVNLTAIRDGQAEDPALQNDDRIVIHRAEGYYKTKRAIELFGGFVPPIGGSR